MANIDIKKIEELSNHRLLYSVRLNGDAGTMEFSIDIQDRGCESANEAAVSMSSLELANELAASARLRSWAGNRR